MSIFILSLTYAMAFMKFVNNFDIVGTFARPSGLALPLIVSTVQLESDPVSIHPAIQS